MPSSDPIYLDYAATTPVDPRVRDRMIRCLSLHGDFANPGSRSHVYGWRAEEAVEQARRQVADAINADPREIVWTSGATESNNLALKGVIDFALANSVARKKHIITSAIEHKAVLDVCAALEKKGVELTYLKPDSRGEFNVDQVHQAMQKNTVMVSLMHVNNELGVINPIGDVGALCRSKGILFHVDAAQSLAREAIDVRAMNIDLLSLSAHKFYGPKGIGALFVRRSAEVNIVAQIHGGGHERGYRSGTLPTHQIVGAGQAAEFAIAEREDENLRQKKLREYFLEGIANLSISENAAHAHKVPGILNLCFHGIDGETLLASLMGIAVSTGSACTSASIEPSYVLSNIGINRVDADSSLRLSFGRFTSKADIKLSLETIQNALHNLDAVRLVNS